MEGLERLGAGCAAGGRVIYIRQQGPVPVNSDTRRQHGNRYINCSYSSTLEIAQTIIV